VPSWFFDPSTAPPQITPFGMLYAIHDALVRPYPRHPGQKIGPPGAGDFPAYQKRRARSHARPLES